MLRARLTPLFFAVLAPIACGAPEDGADLEQSSVDALTAVASFGSNPGGLVMRTYVPASAPANAALVVALHGCSQTADDYVHAGWNELAELEHFYVVYPEQTSSNDSTRCFGWFDTSETARGRGEAASIVSMVDYMKSRYSIDPARVYVTGLSAGGAMTASLLAAYPDVFAAGAVMSGIPAGCASTRSEAYACMSGRELSQTEWANRARSASSSWRGAWPRVGIWHGTSDYTVRDVNRTQLERQWTGVHGLSATASRTETVSGVTHAIFADANGTTKVESWSIPGMGHGTAIDPGFATAGGCGTTGAFILDANICSTWYAWRFFDGPARTTSAPDAGTTSSAPDAGTRDSGTTSTPDAGTTSTPDAGTTSTPDAGTSHASDAGSTSCPDASAPDTGCTCTVPPTTTCHEYEDSNYGHVVAGRAERCGLGGSWVCALGSGTNLGLWSLGIRSWVHTTTANRFDVGHCP